ncbi:MAG: hypothetical protein ACM3UP_01600 [Methanocella sp.]|jgi:hypothetical protein
MKRDPEKEDQALADEKALEDMYAATLKDRRERFIRWQGYRIAQLGTCNQLLLAFTVATLGFAVAQPPQKLVASSDRCGRVCFCLSIIFGAVSFICGIVTQILRLENFRRTARMTRLKMTEPSKRSKTDLDEISKLEQRTGCLDAWTWVLLYGQMATFAVQASSLAIALSVRMYIDL